MFIQVICIRRHGLPYSRLARLNDIYFLRAVESGKSKIKVPADPVSGFLGPGFQKAASLLCPQMAGREQALRCLFL